jgi:hypothetical protein
MCDMVCIGMKKSNQFEKPPFSGSLSSLDGAVWYELVIYKNNQNLHKNLHKCFFGKKNNSNIK